MLGHFSGTLIKGSILLSLLGFGYLVFIKANREERSVKTVGRIIGIAIIAFSLISSMLFTIKTFAKCSFKESHFGMKKSCFPMYKR